MTTKRKEEYGIDEAVRDICSISVAPASKSAVRGILERLLSSRDKEWSERVGEMKKRPTCNRQNGCGLPFIQGRECYDGNLCEDISVPSEYNQALDDVIKALSTLSPREDKK